MNRDLVLDLLQRVVELALSTLAAAPTSDNDAELAADVRDVLLALHFALRRFRDTIAEATNDTAS